MKFRLMMWLRMSRCGNLGSLATLDVAVHYKGQFAMDWQDWMHKDTGKKLRVMTSPRKLESVARIAIVRVVVMIE